MAINPFNKMLIDFEAFFRESMKRKANKTAYFPEYVKRGMKPDSCHQHGNRYALAGIPVFLKKSILFFLVITFFHPVYSQVTDPLPETDIRPVTFSGSLGFLSETYAVRGIDPRRPPAMGQIMLNTNFSLFGLRSGFNMIYSTDDNPLRQSLNKFYYQGTWRWLTVSAGDVAPRFTKYSLGGVTVRGGMIEMQPGVLSVSATAGRTRRRIDFTDEPGFRDPAFEQWLYGLRLGLGRQNGFRFAISGVYAHDVAGSIENWGNTFPSENISLTPEIGISMFQGAFRLESNLTFSAFSKDATSEELMLQEFPGSAFLTSIFAPRTSSRVDYAGEVSTNINAGPFRLSGGYERIQPGFISLGLGQIRSDQEMIRVRPQARLMKGRINIGGTWSRGQNNLMETRISTIYRQQIGTNANLRISPSLNLTVSYMQLHNENKPTYMSLPSVADMHQRQVSRNYMVTPTMVFRSGTMAHSVSVNTSYQVLDDQSPAVTVGIRPATGFTNLSTGISYGTTLPKGLSFNLAGNYLSNDTGAAQSTGYSMNASTGYSFFERRLTTNITLGWSQNGIEYVQMVDRTDPLLQSQYIKRVNGQMQNNGIIEGEYVVRQWSRQLMTNLSTSYRLPNGNPLRLMVRGLLSKPSENGGNAYDEFHATLRYEHRF